MTTTAPGPTRTMCPRAGHCRARLPHRHAYEILHGVRFTLMVPNRRPPPAKG